MNAQYFDEALDIFAQFFQAPLLTAASINKEVQAVDAEDTRNRVLDNRRSLQVLKSVLSSDLWYRKFSTGNLLTLTRGRTTFAVPAPNISEFTSQGAVAQIDEDALARDVREFHKRFYVPQQMKVALVGPQSVAELSLLAEKHFAGIESSSSLTTGIYDSHESDSDHSKEKNIFQQFLTSAVNNDTIIPVLRMRPMQQLRDASFIWPQSDYDHAAYRSSCVSFLRHLLLQRAPNQLCTLLQDTGLATSMSAGERASFSLNVPKSQHLSLFEVSCALTVDGLERWRDILSLLRQSLRKLQQLSEDELRAQLRDFRALSELRFAFQAQDSAYETAADLATSLLYYRPEDVLSGGLKSSSENNLELEKVDDEVLRKLRALLHDLLEKQPLVFLRSSSTNASAADAEISPSSADTETSTGGHENGHWQLFANSKDDPNYLQQQMQYFDAHRQQSSEGIVDIHYFDQLVRFVDQQQSTAGDVLRRELFYGVPFTLTLEPLSPSPQTSSDSKGSRYNANGLQLLESSLQTPPLSRYLCRKLLTQLRTCPSSLTPAQVLGAYPAVSEPNGTKFQTSKRTHMDTESGADAVEDQRNRPLRSSAPQRLVLNAASATNENHGLIRELWRSTDEVFGVPRAIVRFFVPRLRVKKPHSPSDKQSTAREIVQLDLFQNLLEQALQRRFHDAVGAGYGVFVALARQGLSIRASGYSEGVFDLTKEFLESLLEISDSNEQHISVNTCRLRLLREDAALETRFYNMLDRHVRNLRSCKLERQS